MYPESAMRWTHGFVLLGAVAIIITAQLPAQKPVATGSIEGILMDQTGALIGPPPEQAFHITLRGDSSEWATINSEVGEYRFDHLLSGEYEMEIEASYFGPLEVRAIHLDPGQSLVLPVIVLELPPSQLRPPPYSLEPGDPESGVVISGVVREVPEGDGTTKSSPLEGVKVEVHGLDNTGMATAITDSDGSFKIRMLYAGRYQMSVALAHYFPFSLNVTVTKGWETVVHPELTRCPDSNEQCTPRIFIIE